MTKKHESLAERIADLAKEKGWSNTALSLRAGLGKGAVTDLVQNTGRTPRRATIRALARALGVDPAYLAGEVDVRPENPVIIEGHGWEVVAQDASISNLLTAIEGVLDSGAGGLVAYTAQADILPLGVIAGDTLLVDRVQAPGVGDLVIHRGADGRTGAAYLISPYLVSMGPGAAINHALVSDDSGVLGRIVFICRSV